MNLGALKTYRRHVEDGLRLELAELERKLRLAEDSLARLQAAADEGAAAYLADARAGLQADEVAGRFEAWEALARAVAASREVVAEARLRRDRKMEQVLDASRDKKQVELLEERDRQEGRRREARRAQHAMDEAAALRHARGG